MSVNDPFLPLHPIAYLSWNLQNWTCWRLTDILADLQAPLESGSGLFPVIHCQIHLPNSGVDRGAAALRLFSSKEAHEGLFGLSTSEVQAREFHLLQWSWVVVIHDGFQQPS